MSKQTIFLNYKNASRLSDYNDYTNEELVEKIKAGVDTKDNLERLFVKNLPVIYMTAKKYSYNAELDDCMQSAFLGLYEAVTRYDANSEYKFTTYLSQWIKQAIYAFKEKDQQYYIPRHMLNKISLYKKAVHDYNLKYECKPTREELSVLLDVSLKEIKDIEKVMRAQKPTSLDMDLSNDGEDNSTVGDVVPGSEGIEEGIVDSIYGEQYRNEVWKLVEENTSEMENKVLKSCYIDKSTLEAIGLQYGQSSDAIRYSRDKALKKLRQRKTSKRFEEFLADSSLYVGNGVQSYKNRMFTSRVESTVIKRLS